MRRFTIFAIALAAGGAVDTANAANAGQIVATPATSPLPPGFPDTDPAALGASCAVYLGLAQRADARPGGHDGPILEQAAGQWRAWLRIHVRMTGTEVDQLVGSTVNPLMDTPAAERDGAAGWCVDHAPEPGPER
jgi:hypothetical protein